MAWDNLALSAVEQEQIHLTLQPVFADYGFELSKSQHGFFYIKSIVASSIPDFNDAADMLGCDLIAHLPKDKKWLALFNECQIILHNHPLNAIRASKHQTPVNGLWYWGQGKLPKETKHSYNKIFTDDFMLSAMMSVNHQYDATDTNHQLIDARKVRDWQQIEDLFDASKEFIFDFTDGTQWHWKPTYRWSFWRHSALTFS
jgi:hypothetical protein